MSEQLTKIAQNVRNALGCAAKMCIRDSQQHQVSTRVLLTQRFPQAGGDDRPDLVGSLLQVGRDFDPLAEETELWVSLAERVLQTLSADIAPKILRDQANGFIQDHRRRLQARATRLAPQFAVTDPVSYTHLDVYKRQ